MKKLFGLLVGISLLMLVPLGADAAGPYDYATGAGELPRFPQPGGGFFAPRKVSFSAHDGPNGFSGHVRSHPGPDAPRVVFTDFSGPVTCVLVEGNRAVVGGVIAKSTVEENVGKTFMFAVEDNGNPSDATADRLSAYFIFPPEVLDPEDCTAGTELYAFLAPITSGNLSVYDAL